MKLETIISHNKNSWPYTHSTMLPNLFDRFYGPDCKSLYERNLKYAPEDWIYRDKDVTYKFNSSGLRMSKEISEIKDDFIYVAGGSFSMGIGVPEEKRFGDLIAKDLNLDVINHSGPTYSTKIQLLSFLNFLKYNKKPKILIIDYPPSFAHYSYIEDKTTITYASKHIPDTKYNNLFNEMLNTPEFLKNESSLNRLMLQNICAINDVKLIELSFRSDDPFVVENNIYYPDLESITDINFRFGRDLMKISDNYSGHPGIGVMELVRKDLLEKIA